MLLGKRIPVGDVLEQIISEEMISCLIEPSLAYEVASAKGFSQ